MTLERLVYVSESRIEAAETNQVVARLVKNSRTRNACLAVSGALLFTGTHFAQILEGPPDSIAVILSALLDDTRHSNILIAAHFPINKRLFPEWQMAYHGPSQYVAKHVKRMLHVNPQSDHRRTIERLTQMFLEFCD